MEETPDGFPDQRQNEQSSVTTLGRTRSTDRRPLLYLPLNSKLDHMFDNGIGERSHVSLLLGGLGSLVEEGLFSPQPSTQVTRLKRPPTGSLTEDGPTGTSQRSWVVRDLRTHGHSCFYFKSDRASKLSGGFRDPSD